MDEISERPATPAGLDAEGAKRAFDQMWENHFGPEVAKRQAAGLLPAEFKVFMAQLLIPPDGDMCVLINDEVQGVGLMRASRAVEAGDKVTLADLAHIEAYDLPDNLLDHGHFTVINRGQDWGIHFNFLRGRAKAKDRLVNAGHFLEAAKESAEKGHAGPAVENLFAAAELASKAELILSQSPARDAKTHGAVSSAINAYSRTGNIDRAFVSLFNQLGQQRPNARYGDSQSRPAAPSAEDLDLVAAVIERGLTRVIKSTDR